MNAQAIKQYEAPQWLIEPIGDVVDYAAEVEPYIDRTKIIQTDIRGWDPYTHIVRVWVDGDRTDYLTSDTPSEGN